jgi:hypothetical protein
MVVGPASGSTQTLEAGPSPPQPAVRSDRPRDGRDHAVAGVAGFGAENRFDDTGCDGQSDHVGADVPARGSGASITSC